MSMSDRLMELDAEFQALQDEYERNWKHMHEKAVYNRSKEILARQQEIMKAVTTIARRVVGGEVQDESAVLYPEHVKMRLVSDKSNTIGNFIDWLHEQDMAICRRENHPEEPAGYWPVLRRTERLLADYFNIDLDKIAAEKDAMLEVLRGQQTKED